MPHLIISNKYIDVLKFGGARTFVHNPILEARHWAIIDCEDVNKGAFTELIRHMHWRPFTRLLEYL
jgi:hypothetical protein